MRLTDIPIDGRRGRGHDPAMTDDPDLPEDFDEVDPREAERIRRRDHDAEAEQRALLRPGMGKVFKQIQDAQRSAADDLPDRPPKARRRRPTGR
jgi:hypothetical protein